MIKRVLLAAMLAGAVLSAGCLEVTTVVLVKKDGSGLVSETTYMGKALTDMMNQMAAGLGGEAGAAKPSGLSDDDLAKYKRKAAKMGSGVRFVSAQEVKAADGRSGTKALWAFDDIGKLALAMNPDNPQAGGMGEGMSVGVDGGEKQKKPVTFEFTPGSPAQLGVNLPQKKAGDGASDSETPADAGDDMADGPEGAAMMKQMFDGFRVRMLVKVDGDITRSNASYLQKGSKSGRTQYVTLFDMNIGQMLSDPAKLEKLTAMGEMDDMAEAMARLKDVPGLKIELNERVEIDFE